MTLLTDNMLFVQSCSAVGQSSPNTSQTLYSQLIQNRTDFDHSSLENQTFIELDEFLVLL